MHRCDPAVFPVRPGIRRDEQRAGERDQLDHEGGNDDRSKRRRPLPEQHEPRQVRGEGEDEQPEEDRSERAAAGPAAVGRHERRGLDPSTGDATGDEDADRTRGEQARAGQGSSGSVVAGGAGCEAGGASGTESVCSVVVVGSVVVVVVSVVVAGGV